MSFCTILQWKTNFRKSVFFFLILISSVLPDFLFGKCYIDLESALISHKFSGKSEAHAMQISDSALRIPLEILPRRTFRYIKTLLLMAAKKNKQKRKTHRERECP